MAAWQSSLKVANLYLPAWQKLSFHKVCRISMLDIFLVFVVQTCMMDWIEDETNCHLTWGPILSSQCLISEGESVLWMFSFPLYWLSVIRCSSFESVAEQRDTQHTYTKPHPSWTPTYLIQSHRHGKNTVIVKNVTYREYIELNLDLQIQKQPTLVGFLYANLAIVWVISG